MWVYKKRCRHAEYMIN